MSNVYKETTSSVEALLMQFKNDEKSVKDVSIELERVYKNMFTQFGSNKVYAKYGISKTGKVMIDYKKHGHPINLSQAECLKLNNILSSRNFENYIRSQQELITERSDAYFASRKTTKVEQQVEQQVEQHVEQSE
jgi:hypothetical protein